MSDFSQLVPEHVRSLGGYTPGKSLRQAQRESQVDCIKMASNENPFGPSPRAVDAMRATLSDTNFYPDNDAAELRQKLAEYYRTEGLEDPVIVDLPKGGFSLTFDMRPAPPVVAPVPAGSVRLSL